MDTKTTEKELLKLEKDYWQAMKDNDFDTMLRLTDDPVIVTGPQGVSRITREEFKKMMKETPYTLNSFELKGDAKVRVLDDDVAILAYSVHEELTVDGKPVTVDAAEASTWTRRDGQWVCSLHCEAISGDPYGRDRKSV